jgi:hypothetical protein
VNTERYIGLDVHQATISVAVVDSGFATAACLSSSVVSSTEN